MSTPRAVIKQLTHSRVVDAAAHLFVEEGFAGTSIRGIAQAAGVSVGTVMSVGDKSALLVRVFDLLVEAELAKRAAVVDQTSPEVAQRAASADIAGLGPGAGRIGGNCPDRLVGLTAPLVALFTRHDELARAYASILISGGREAGLFSDLATSLTEKFRTVITERGCTAEGDAAARAGALYFAFIGLLFTAAAGGTSDPEALSADVRGAFDAICACRE
ncbi:TetR/AcrR family transcriptional regulator [Pseudoclavibacter sp. VKM Ac-2867]|uniref:TetR/AcrR family transcriptional regulator n=1 Tax=Pseudoclavibacter sp. VKM Ac-2867 TaxID=2783829 RepID=UPI001889FB27|nr:TetR/AcrR family transcriptional regulator [Pseudoclavibacter sp. VKM Ac-2867]MBF4459297.1 TetR/AcrR family transcriptional regulator [Pseudoclavibacter sp. VKM Ac-2867]